LQAALDLIEPEDPDRARLLFAYVRTKWDLGESEFELTQRVHDLALASGQRELAAEALSLLADQRWTLGEIDLASKHSTQAFALVADAPPSRTKTHTRVGLANRLWISGQEEEGLMLARKGLEEAESLGAEDVAANALRGIGTVRAARGDEGGFDDLARSAELGEKLSDPLVMHQAYNNLANMHWHFGRIAEGARCLKVDREIQARFGLAPAAARGSTSSRPRACLRRRGSRQASRLRRETSRPLPRSTSQSARRAPRRSRACMQPRTLPARGANLRRTRSS